MHEHDKKKQAREVFMACEGGALSLCWWKSGRRVRRRKAAADESPPPDADVQQRRRDNRMRTGLALRGFLMSDPKPKHDIR